MLTSWLLYASALGALLGLVALLAERIARWRARPARWIWLAAIVAIVMIPIGLSLRPGTPVSSSRPHASGAVPFDQPSGTADTPLLILWLLASTLLASRIAGTAIALRRRRNRWVPATLGGHSILLADQLGPAVIGWRRLTTVIPRWALSLDEGSRSLILQHEAEHARSGDPYLRSVALVALVIMPWNPAIWWAMRRLRLAIEIDCDQRVLGRGVDAHHYATLLLAVGERMSTIPFAWATALGGSRSFLERRIIAMTTSFRPRRSRGAIIAVSAAIALIVAVACESPVPDPIAPTFASGADSVGTLYKVVRDGYMVPDCEAGTACGADAGKTVRLKKVPGRLAVVSDSGERVMTVDGRKSREAFTVRYDPAGALREVQGVRLVPTDSTPR